MGTCQEDTRVNLKELPFVKLQAIIASKNNKLLRNKFGKGGERLSH